MKTVGINGYGTIGKRVADAVRAQPDMEIAGVVKTSPDYVAEGAIEAGYDLYTVEGSADAFAGAGLEISGTVDELTTESDVIVDATPGGIGEQNAPQYAEQETKAIFQGAESDALVEQSFTARANYEEAVGADTVRVVSCNTTALGRLVAPLEEAYGIDQLRVTLVRRGGDPAQSGRGPIDDILPNPTTIPSHHGPDLETVFPELDVTTLGMKVPATHMHVHGFNVTLEEAPDEDEVLDLLDDQSRIFLVPTEAGIDGAGALKELAHDRGRPRGDIWENCLWENSLTVEGRDLYCFQAVHQESNVIPENVDAIRAMFDEAGKDESIAKTNEALGMGL